MDHIHSSQKRMKGLQSHQTMQQMTADVPTSSMMSLPCYDSGTYLSHLAEGEYGFDILGLNYIILYQMYVVVPTVHSGIPFVGVGLVYRCSNLHVGDIKERTIFLKTFFAHCENSVYVAPSQAFFLRERRKLGPLCCVAPLWLLSLNPFTEFRIWNNSSSSDVLYIQASISISPKYESKSKTTSHCHLLLHDCTNAAV